MGRAEKYADVIKSYEKELAKLDELQKEENDKLSITREIKYEELQNELDKKTKKKQEENIKTVEIKEETKDIKIIDEKTDKLIALTDEEMNQEISQDEDDLFLTKSMNPLNRKKLRLRGFVKVLIALLILVLVGLIVFFKVIKPLYFNISNSDPRKVFENGFDLFVNKANEAYNKYVTQDLVNINITTKIDSNMYHFGNDVDAKYTLNYGYDAKKKRVFSNVAINKGETYNNLFVVDNKMVYEKLSSYENNIKLEDVDKILGENQFYLENKNFFNNIFKYVSPSEIKNYYESYTDILKDNFRDEMFTKKNDKLERVEYKLNVVKNTKIFKKEDLKRIDDAIQNKTKTDSSFKRAYDLVGGIIDTSKEKVIVNIYTKLNNDVVGFDVEEDGFTTTFIYILTSDVTNYDAHFNINKKVLSVSRRNNKITGTYGANAIEFTINIKEWSENKVAFSYDINKDLKKYTGDVDVVIDEAAKKYSFDIKAKENTSYINAVGVLDFNINKELFNIDLSKMIDPTVTQLDTMHQEFKTSFSTDDLYQKYDSWYGIVTKPNILTVK